MKTCRTPSFHHSLVIIRTSANNHVGVLHVRVLVHFCHNKMYMENSQRLHVTLLNYDLQIISSCVQYRSEYLYDDLCLLQEGHVYMLSYPELDNLKWSTDYKGKYERHITSPICLLYVNKDDKCVPLAINLELGGPVWTPRDAPLDWKLAKMWVREADVQVHQVVSRHLHTQLVTEAVAIATLRNLPTAHPVYKILYPHVKYTIAVNVMGRQFLYPAEDGLFQKYLAVGGQHGDLIQIAYRSFNINDLHLPSNLAARGVADVNLLPGYWYRDDGLAVWTAMEKYIRTVLYMHYWNDDNVKADGELQAWIQDLGHNGLTEWDYIDGDDPDQHGIPSALTSLDELLHYLTIFVFTASAQHAALSSGMMDYYSYVPNAPTMMMTSPPAIKGMVTSTYLKKALPSRGKTAEIIAACYTLSRHGKHEVSDYLSSPPITVTLYASMMMIPAQICITFTSGVVIMSKTNCNISHILRGDTVNNCIHNEYTFM